MRYIKTTTLLLILGLCIVRVAGAQDRSLSWDALTVSAQLDAQGALHVIERHAMVFDGEWNGGERTFQLRSWQSLALNGVSEIDPRTQAAVVWSEGDLSDIGEYQLNGNTLRWRSRMPADPPFTNTTKVYEISYVLSGVLIPDNGVYRLEHNLAFPDRAGVIRTFDATLAIDPAWLAVDVPTRWHQENLQPGESVFVNASLQYVGAGEPAALAKVSSLPSATSAPALRYTLLLIVIAFVAVHVIALLRREQRNGRFEPALPLDQIDEQWLRRNLFDRPPEVVGAAWDLDTSASEVAALLARLTQEGALKTEVRSSGSGWFKRDVMYMELLCDRDRLADHERELIDALFFGGSRMTDSQKIREHYAKSGFTPAAYIKKGVEAQLPIVFASKLAVPAWAKWLTAALFVAAIATFIVAVIQGPDATPPLLIGEIILLVCFIVGLVFAYVYRSNVHELRSKLIRTLICVGLMYAVLAFVLISGRIAIVLTGTVSLTLLTLAFVNSIFNMMRMREVGESLELRRRLTSARIYFEQELKKPQPNLKDEWFPYLLAFGLGPKIDRWFKSTGAEASPGVRRSSSGAGVGGSLGSSSSSSSSTPAWTGGGGTFGGAGASGAWSAAAGGIAAGVAKPSSSSGGSSGGGSSSSSGGGGGGGW
jgi:uncharacterized membrane protein YgcG